MKKIITVFVLILFVLMFSKPTFGQLRQEVFLPFVTTPLIYAIDCIDQHGHLVECDK